MKKHQHLPLSDPLYGLDRNCGHPSSRHPEAAGRRTAERPQPGHTLTGGYSEAVGERISKRSFGARATARWLSAGSVPT